MRGSLRFLTVLGLFAQVSLASLCTVARANDGADAVEGPPGTSAGELGLTALTDDPSPQELFAEVIAASAKDDPGGAAEGVQYFNLNGPFRFPNDTTFDLALHQPRTNSLFGVDISHWTDPGFPVEQLASRNVLFLYMKATQGQGLDGSFAPFWARAGKLPQGRQVHRGAYHFLTCGDPAVSGADWGKAQADAFIKVIKANGGLTATDMPPTVDLEWDKTKTEHDRWTCRTPSEVIATVKAFQERVKAALNRVPVIYTARAWWRERMGAESAFSALAGYPIWIADYSKSSRASEVPPQINKTAWSLWQFTDSATMAIGYNRGFDANVFKGTKDEFLHAFGVADLQ